MARVRWIGGARVVPGIGAPEQGKIYDWPEDVAASLIAQGHAEAAERPTAPTTAATRSLLRGTRDDEGEE